MSDIAVAAVLAGTILAASTISVEIGLSVALVELLAGVVVGNAFHLAVPGWLGFIGSFAGILLTFQAGPPLAAELRDVGLLAYYGLGWDRRQAEIARPALSTTSLAVVYAVLVETGLNREVVGKRLMSATFVTDIATVAGLTALFGGKMLPKLGGVYPLARRYTAPHAGFTTLLMSTGLTFGTITSLYGLNAGIVDRTQFSLLIAVVVLSAIVPTAIAQRFFHPREEAGRPASTRTVPDTEEVGG